MQMAEKLDEYGKPAWIALTVLGFMAWWPLGLAVLAFSIGSGRMGCAGRRGGFGRWQVNEDSVRNWYRGRRGFTSSGNRAFDEYRDQTISRLEEEQREFKDFLERLRQAKDKSEFDAFMRDRRERPAAPQPPVQDAQQG
ncbi:MAG TPA: DUF2852 domain-containing protein [Xanthobacteraceae bacterium]|nr:DUF2852 domain-containing protein [Xanthobacteraceae bacterium]